jgi:hypothetical protein
MIAEKIKLLESIKQRQYSKLIALIHDRVIDTLKSPHFNSRLAPYLSKMNKEGIPFTDYDLDPDNISQIKKLINALYHGRQAVLDIEAIDLNINSVDLKQFNKTKENLSLLYTHTTHEAYQACYLLTHLDVDVREMFGEELQLLVPILGQLQTFVEDHSEDTKKFAESLRTYPLSYKIGEVTGIAVEQMQPNSGDLDYKFLTQFSADLPGYINKLTGFIRKYSYEIMEKEPALDNTHLQELQTSALTLLNELENLKTNSVFLPLKVINYIHIISNIITLSMSSLEQIEHFSDSSQDVIRDNLAQLKYVVLPSLFGLVDKIEDNTMLKPGTLSIPLMEQIKPLYELLIYYASKPVDFQEKGEELLSIEDSRFVALRLEQTYKRIDQANKALFKVKKAQDALNQFYEILENPQYKDVAIHQLPQEVKIQLISHYKILRPYMTKLDYDLNDRLIDSLQGPETWTSYLAQPWRWLRGTLPADHVSIIVAKRDGLQNLISKKRATQQFHIDLNMDLIDSVNKQTNLVLFPYSEKTNVFAIDEKSALNITDTTKTNLVFRTDKGNTLLTNPKQLNADQALDLYQYYRNKREKFLVAKNAYDEFNTLLKKQSLTLPKTKNGVLRLDRMDKSVKDQCRNLYNLFQPYFINGIPEELRASVLSFDKYLVHSFTDQTSSSGSPSIDMFAQLNEHFQIYFTEIDLSWGKKSRIYERLAQEKFAEESNALALEHDKAIGKRGHHLIQHTNYSKGMNEFRTNLNQILTLFNKSMQAELKINTSGLPFPELGDPEKLARQSKQVLALKRIFNGMYHLEGIFIELEKLDNRSAETLYMYHLLQAYGHIEEIINITQEVAADPHFGLIGRELFENAQTLIATFQEHSDAYQVSPLEVPHDEAVTYNALWYVLNAFHIAPKHIRSLRNNNYLTAEELNELHLNAKKTTVNIEAIIKSSGSYFQLFLQTPNMYFLYRDLSSRLNEFVTTSHDTVIHNLDQFRAKIFTPMLLEADQWEDKLGLIPGTVSGPLKQLTDEYYKGLLHSVKLDSKTHIGMICDKAPLEKRKTVTDEKIVHVKQQLAKLDANYKHINDLFEKINSYEQLSGGLVPASQMIIEFSRKNLLETYKKALPKLAQLQKKIKVDPTTTPKSEALDALLNSQLEEYVPHFSHIKSLVAASRHRYLSSKASYEMELSTATEKLSYLNELTQTQSQANLLFIKEYTTESFDKQMTVFCNRHVGLQYTDKEYRNKLKEYLLTFKDTIIDEAQTADDINLNVKNLLKKKIKLFEEENFTKYYHLDTVRVALSEFKNYFSVSNLAIESSFSIFEDEETLARKTKKINKIIDIAENESLSIDDRFNQIKAKVENVRFNKIMLDYKKEDTFSFTYLIQCILSLLEALYLYTPSSTKLHNNLKSAVDTKPQIGELTKRFGLFATPPTAPEDVKEEETLEATAAAATAA